MPAGGVRAAMQQRGLGDEPVCPLGMEERLLSATVSWGILGNDDLHDPS